MIGVILIDPLDRRLCVCHPCVDSFSSGDGAGRHAPFLEALAVASLGRHRQRNPKRLWLRGSGCASSGRWSLAVRDLRFLRFPESPRRVI